MKIYIVAHKDFEMPVNEDIYAPILVGASECDSGQREYFAKKGFLFDDTGDNISCKNPEYCELTGLYWMWKNSDEKIIGLCHYRRFFTNPISKIRNVLSGKKNIVLSEKKVDRILDKYDIIMHNRTIVKDTVYRQYSVNHSEEDLITIKTIIEENYPEYLDDFLHVMNRRYVHFLNMFIMKKEMMDDYCEWIFDVLGRLEEIYGSSGRNTDRLYGFISEILFDVWVTHKKLKVKEMFSINLERIDRKLIV